MATADDRARQIMENIGSSRERQDMKKRGFLTSGELHEVQEEIVGDSHRYRNRAMRKKIAEEVGIEKDDYTNRFTVDQLEEILKQVTDEEQHFELGL